MNLTAAIPSPTTTFSQQTRETYVSAARGTAAYCARDRAGVRGVSEFAVRSGGPDRMAERAAGGARKA